MFNSNKKQTAANKVNTNSTGKNLPSINMISEGTQVTGTLNTKNDIRIAGKLEGEAKAQGKLIISSSGNIDGDVEAVDADIAGKLKGEIHVSNKLILRQSAVINGDIYTKSLLVEEGAQINGACRMNEEGKSSSSSGSSRSGSFLGKSSGKKETASGEKEKEKQEA